MRTCASVSLSVNNVEHVAFFGEHHSGENLDFEFHGVEQQEWFLKLVLSFLLS